jgi:hypothetical protein
MILIEMETSFKITAENSNDSALDLVRGEAKHAKRCDDQHPDLDDRKHKHSDNSPRRWRGIASP